MESQFTVLMVCTGNVCRSPLAELLLKEQCSDVQSLTVHSAGIRALIDAPMDPTSQLMAQSLGLESGFQEHRGRQLDASLAESADLVLTMTRSQRRAVVELAPRTTKRVFTLREFARLAAATTDSDLRDELDSTSSTDSTNTANPTNGTTAERLRAGIRAAALTRSDINAPMNPADDDVVDPYRESTEIYEESTQQLAPAVSSVSQYFHRVLEVAAS